MLEKRSFARDSILSMTLECVEPDPETLRSSFRSRRR